MRVSFARERLVEPQENHNGLAFHSFSFVERSQPNALIYNLKANVYLLREKKKWLSRRTSHSLRSLSSHLEMLR